MIVQESLDQRLADLQDRARLLKHQAQTRMVLTRMSESGSQRPLARPPAVPETTERELSTKLCWAVISTLRVGGYGKHQRLRRWADRLASDLTARQKELRGSTPR